MPQKVTHHKKVIAGADLIVVLSKYPAPPATMQPTARPTMILIFFRNGDPNSSVSMIDMKDRKPRPINSGEPHLKEYFVSERYSCREANERKGPWRTDIRTECKEAIRWSASTRTRATSPVGHPGGSDKRCTNHDYHSS